MGRLENRSGVHPEARSRTAGQEELAPDGDPTGDPGYRIDLRAFRRGIIPAWRVAGLGRIHQAADVRWFVVKAGLPWLLVGIGIGVPASIALAKILQNRIWGIKTADPLTLGVVALVLTAVGLAACYFPARRATKVDPMVALRYE